MVFGALRAVFALFGAKSEDRRDPNDTYVHPLVVAAQNNDVTGIKAAFPKQLYGAPGFRSDDLRDALLTAFEHKNYDAFEALYVEMAAHDNGYSNSYSPSWSDKMERMEREIPNDLKFQEIKQTYMDEIERIKSIGFEERRQEMSKRFAPVVQHRTNFNRS